MTIGIIIQARMTSKRFPGKVMATLAGKTVLQRVIERARLVPFIDTIICACPEGDASEPIIEECERQNISTYQGSEDDVLGRYYDAASAYQLTKVVRITADCPFFNPLVAGEVIALLGSMNLDYVSNAWPKRTYPKGYDVEAFTYDCLEAAAELAKTDYDREHVTPWMQKEPEVHKMNLMQKVNVSEVNLCVDVPGDIARLEPTVMEQAQQLERIKKMVKIFSDRGAHGKPH